MTRPEPLRTCLGCREEKEKQELLRFVLDPERTLVPDILARLPGRGAYTCFRRACVIAAVQRKQFTRAFKGEVKGAAADELVEQVTSRLEERLASYLALANKAGKIVSGSDMVMDALRKGKRIGIVLAAADISRDIREKVLLSAKRENVPFFNILDKDCFGRVLGKGLRSVVAVEESGFVPQILKEIRRYGNFLDGGAVDEQDPCT